MLRGHGWYRTFTVGDIETMEYLGSRIEVGGHSDSDEEPLWETQLKQLMESLLSEEDYSILVGRFYDRLTYEQLAEKYGEGRTKGWVQRRILRSLRLLREHSNHIDLPFESDN